MSSSVQTAHVLLVDDDRALRSLMRLWLEGAAYHVTEAEDGGQALKQARLRKPDLIITDLVMPNQEGLETIPVLRNEFPGMPVIAMSGAFHGEMLRVASRLGASIALPKPFTEDSLLQAVESALKAGDSG
jgi:CheY-like chemotaxis protein